MFLVKAIASVLIGAVLMGPLGAIIGLILFVVYDAKNKPS